MNTNVKESLSNAMISNFDFPVYYRSRGQMINQKLENIPPLLPAELSGLEVKEAISGSDVRDLLLEENGHSVLWLLNATNNGDKSLLDTISTLFENINKVTRGGINVYKQNGWMTHVLYVYELISFNFAKNIIPTSFASTAVALKDKICILSDIYANLKQDSKYLVRLLALIHDIGVVDGVQNHDKDGEKYVSKMLEDLGITNSYLREYDINVSLENLVRMLKIFIANHTLINKVSSEDGDVCIKEKVEAIKKQLFTDDDSQIDYSDFASIFLLIGMADLIAVDDSLFTVRKFELAYSSYQYLNALFNEYLITRHYDEIALSRLYEMIPENTYSDLREETDMVLTEDGVKNTEKFWINLYDVYKFEYSTAYFKALKSLPLVVRSLSQLFSLIEHRGNKFSECVIKFSSNINSDIFAQAVVTGDMLNCISVLYSLSSAEGNFLKMSVSCERGKTFYTIEQL